MYVYILDILLQNPEFGGYIFQEKVKVLLMLSYSHDPKDEKRQQVGRAYQDIAFTCSASCSVREVNFVGTSLTTENDLSTETYLGQRCGGYRNKEFTLRHV